MTLSRSASAPLDLVASTVGKPHATQNAEMVEFVIKIIPAFASKDSMVTLVRKGKVYATNNFLLYLHPNLQLEVLF